MEISAKTEYAVRAMLQLADAEQGTLVTTEALAGAQALPRKFLESILVDLRSAGFVTSRRGQHGGHALARPAEQIRVGDLIRAIDGPLAPMRCASVSAYQACVDCADPETCGLRGLMREARDALSQVLDQRSLRDLSQPEAARWLTTNGELQ